MAPQEGPGVRDRVMEIGPGPGGQCPEGLGMRERQEVLGHRETELRFGNRGQRTEDWTLGMRGQDGGQKTREEV